MGGGHFATAPVTAFGEHVLVVAHQVFQTVVTYKTLVIKNTFRKQSVNWATFCG